MAEDEGFDSIIVSIPSSRNRADVHRTSALKRVRIPYFDKIKTRYPNGYLVFMAEDEGFEPPQTESESGVLPLHKSSMSKHGYHYTHSSRNVKRFLENFLKFPPGHLQYARGCNFYTTGFRTMKDCAPIFSNFSPSFASPISNTGAYLPSSFSSSSSRPGFTASR